MYANWPDASRTCIYARVAPSQPGWGTWGPHVSQRTSCAHRQSAPVPTLALLFLFAFLYQRLPKERPPPSPRGAERDSDMNPPPRPPSLPTDSKRPTRQRLQVAPNAQQRSCGAGAAATRTEYPRAGVHRAAPRSDQAAHARGARPDPDQHRLHRAGFRNTDFMISALVRWTRPTDLKLNGDNGLNRSTKESKPLLQSRQARGEW